MIEIPIHPIISKAFYLSLSENEKAIFNAIRTQKYAVNAHHLYLATKISRSNVLRILKKFHEWKLVKEIRQNKRTVWLYNRQLKYLQKITHVLLS